MRKHGTIFFAIILSCIAVVAVFGFAQRGNQRAMLQAELEAARAESAEVARLRTENVRLRQKQIPEPELQALRADHAALPRLRAELEALQQAQRSR
jgi:hypothetical protein